MKLFRGRQTTYRLYRETKTKAIHFSLAMILLGTSASGLAPLFTQSSASAFTQINVTPSNPNGWDATTLGAAEANYVSATGAVGAGALQFKTTADVDDYVRLKHVLGLRLDQINTLSYQTLQQSVPDAAKGYASITLRLWIDTNEDGTFDDQLMYEPYYNGTVTADWQTWDAKDGKFWSNFQKSYNGLGGSGAGSYATNFKNTDVLHDFPNASVTDISLSMGSYNPSWQILADNLRVNDNAYNFEPTQSTPPTNLRAVAGGKTIACGGATNALQFAPTWDAVVDATSYDYQYMRPASANWQNGGSYTSPTTGPTAFGTVEGVEGTWQFRVRSVSTNGTSEWSPACTITFDKTAPTTPVVSLTDNNGRAIPHTGFITTEFFNFSLPEGNHHYRLKYWTTTPGSPFNNEANAWAPTDISSFMLNPSTYRDRFSQGEGTHYFSFSAVDAAGNISGWSPAYQVIYDKTLPIFTLSTVNGTAFDSTVNSYEHANKLVIAGSFTDNLAANYLQIELVKDGNLVTVVTKHGALANGTLAEFDASTLADGQYEVFATATDHAGNVSERRRHVFTLNNTIPDPQVLGENFNTHQDSNYSGINVGFSIQDFQTVSGVTVTLEDNGAEIVTNTQNQALLNIIAGGTTQLSTPFITISGSYVEDYWNLGAYTWTSTSPTPTAARITVLGTDMAGNASTKTIRITPLRQGQPSWPTFQAILPPAPVPPAPAGGGAEDDQTGQPNGQVLGAQDASNGGSPAGRTGTSSARSVSGRLASVNTVQLASTEEATETPEEAAAGEVKGASTSTPALSGSAADDSIVLNVAEKNSNFLGLGWWWLPILVVTLGLLWLLFGRRRHANEK